MLIRFRRDADGQPHIWRHGVTEEEVLEAFARRGEDRPGDNDSRVAIGHTRAGRILRLVYSPDPGGRSAFLVTAYDLVGKPLRAYNRRRKRRGGRRPA